MWISTVWMIFKTSRWLFNSLKSFLGQEVDMTWRVNRNRTFFFARAPYGPGGSVAELYWALRVYHVRTRDPGLGGSRTAANCLRQTWRAWSIGTVHWNKKWLLRGCVYVHQDFSAQNQEPLSGHLTHQKHYSDITTTQSPNPNHILTQARLGKPYHSSLLFKAAPALQGQTYRPCIPITVTNLPPLQVNLPPFNVKPTAPKSQ